MRSITISKRSFFSGCAAFALLLTFVATGHGADGNWTTHLTFSGTVALPGTVLPAGAYTFEAVRPDVVRVTSRDGRRVFYAGFTHRVERPAGLRPDVFISLGEGPRGNPVPINAWYPTEKGLGHQFIYR